MNKIKIVLIVESDPINKFILDKILSKCGLRIVSTDSTLQALKYFKHQYFDLIITDLIMAGMDGLTFATKVREVEQSKQTKTPIILTITSPLDDSLMPKISGLEPLEVFEKPISYGDMLDVINRLMA
ncbi:response regulator [Desulfovibrio sp. TomC]|uniref:response regulator n=1 Tax=Desulfovibrio sp. TomC TaxID=1562888 RepID=UPI00069CD93B|nr:response regulator [Desulfovibrio sp. TomC]